MRRWIGAVAVVALAVATAVADSWMAPVSERFVDGDGNYHVVVSPNGKFRYARRGEGTPPVEPLRDEEPGGWKSDRMIPLRDGDVELATGELPHRPMDVLVSERGHGFVALDKYANLGYGDIVIVVDAAGRITHEKTLDDLFPKLGTGIFTHSVSSIWWRSGGWIDDARDAVVIVASGEHVRVVDMKTGGVREGTADDILNGVRTLTGGERVLALGLLISKDISGAETTLERLLTDDGVDLATRLRVAVIASSKGDDRGKDIVREAARRPKPEGVSKDDHAYAIRNLGTVLGEEALPLLREAMRGPADEAWHPAQLGFAAMGEAAVPTLLEMVAAKGESSDFRGGAAHALGEIDSKKALEGLLAAVGDEDGYTANAAANAAISIGGADCAAALLAHLRRGCTQDGRIAMFFEDVAYEPSVPVLIDLLARSEKGDFGHRHALQALKFQTLEELGDDAAAWRRWYEAQER